ncbi:phenylalanyl-tRNA synthetase beta chain [Weissella uvarum]|uniref:phenylalanine--tRNA ligase subunit beta n=1 Tax=Weissella uvarum TaxID=1479233 RepID=UPI001960B75A|nr:phenylalanine--tRNA ligase subunit beta [Weissella uvarum]MBM7616642.1 phenylalanyl-tRNA synthetase beta chain [Weissella uvarum]MCM0594900.1 phenylalanine--tRNA ligase subunit beta [Weissella uvarum]
MKVSVNWLREYLPIALPANELAEKISRTAVEVEDQYRPQGDMKKVVIAKVLSVTPHPDSDHLVITQLDAGEDEPIQVVTGAPNVAEGQTVVLAKHGSTIGDGKKIRRGKLRGEPSNGMLSALQELGLDNQVAPKDLEEGIWVFNDADAADLTPGEDAFAVLGFDDDILELGITPNRADMLSMNGTAYEVGAILDENVQLPDYTLTESDEATADLITAEAPADLAKKYAVRVVKDVHVQDSPLWLQRRLWNMGIRPISNVVDVTNLMLLTYGQPLHAFDYDQLPAKQLKVRTAKEGENIKTLDGEDRTAKAGDIVIDSNGEALMFAGVMGGASTEVTDQTTNVVLEAAVFEPKAIRHAARDQNLHSESAQRFERGVDVSATFTALDHAAALIAELGQGTVTKGRVVAQDFDYEAPVVKISTDEINNVLGTQIETAEIAKIFDRLGFGYEELDGKFSVVIPSRRWDISIPADLIEEVARLYGYDNLPATLPVGATTPGQLTEKQKLIRDSRHTLEGLGLNQAISYVLTTPEKATQFQLDTDNEPVEVNYPMSQDRRVTRGSLLTSLLDDVAYNLARKQADVALYEQGRVFASNGLHDLPNEIEHLAGVVTGNVRERDWDQAAQPADFFYLKGLVEQLLTDYGFTDAITYVPNQDRPEMHPGQTADIYVGDTLVGFIGQIHPTTAKMYKINKTFAFELNLSTILTLPRLKSTYEPVSKFPSISRDLAILVDRDVHSADLVETIKAHGGQDLHDVKVFDVYTGENVADDKKSIAYALTFVNREHTLVDDDINAAIERITNALEKQFSAEIR